jgi:hypothetical protein
VLDDVVGSCVVVLADTVNTAVELVGASAVIDAAVVLDEVVAAAVVLSCSTRSWVPLSSLMPS